MGFTGKEADEEIGVTYFGERWLIPRLGRWATPDPLHVHAAGGGVPLNSFHYVHGNLLQARDPLGLVCNPGQSCNEQIASPPPEANYTAADGGESIQAPRALDHVATPGEELTSLVRQDSAAAEARRRASPLRPSLSSSWGTQGDRNFVAFSQGAADTAVDGLILAPVIIPLALAAPEALAIGGAILLVDYALQDEPAQALADIAAGQGDENDYYAAGGTAVVVGGALLSVSEVELVVPELGAADSAASRGPLLEGTGSPRVYRGMRAAGEQPSPGPTARQLGVRPDTDIPVVDGMVQPGTGGMSVAPSPQALPSFRRPPEFGGTGSDPVWGISTSDLGPRLRYVPDSPTHGTIQPAEVMSIGDFQAALCETGACWSRVRPP
jgi:RHS repeat-associated protein